jgi:hypothetical protein
MLTPTHFFLWVSAKNEGKGLKKISSDFSKLIDGVSDIDSLSSEDREIIDKIQEISVLLSAGKEEQQIMSRTIAAVPTLV